MAPNEKCDVCGRPATAHAVHIKSGKKCETHRCAEHGHVATEMPAGNVSRLMIDGITYGSQAEYLEAMGLRPLKD